MWSHPLYRLDEAKEQYNLFHPLGVHTESKKTKCLFIMCLFFYIVTVVGNLLIIMTITLIKTMNAPMYFFLATLSFMDVTYSSSSSPRLISDLLFGENTTSFETCMTQHFIEHSFQWIKSLPSVGNGLWPLRGHL